MITEGPILSIEILSKFIPKNSQKFALIEDLYIKGGFFALEDSAELESLPNSVIKEGCLVHLNDDSGAGYYEWMICTDATPGAHVWEDANIKASTLGELSDVTLATPMDSDDTGATLQWDGSKWFDGFKYTTFSVDPSPTTDSSDGYKVGDLGISSGKNFGLLEAVDVTEGAAKWRAVGKQVTQFTVSKDFSDTIISGGFSTIQAAINAARLAVIAGYTATALIKIGPGVFTEGLSNLNRSMILEGSGKSEDGGTVINGRVSIYHNSSGIVLTLRNLCIIPPTTLSVQALNISGNAGGTGCKVIIDDCLIKRTTTQFDAAFHIDENYGDSESAIIIKNSVIVKEYAGASTNVGAALDIENFPGSLTVSNCSIYSNSDDIFRGAVSIYKNNVKFTACTFVAHTDAVQLHHTRVLLVTFVRCSFDCGTGIVYHIVADTGSVTTVIDCIFNCILSVAEISSGNQSTNVTWYYSGCSMLPGSSNELLISEDTLLPVDWFQSFTMIPLTSSFIEVTS